MEIFSWRSVLARWISSSCACTRLCRTALSRWPPEKIGTDRLRPTKEYGDQLYSLNL